MRMRRELSVIAEDPLDVEPVRTKQVWMPFHTQTNGGIFSIVG